MDRQGLPQRSGTRSPPVRVVRPRTRLRFRSKSAWTGHRRTVEGTGVLAPELLGERHQSGYLSLARFAVPALSVACGAAPRPPRRCQSSFRLGSPAERHDPGTHRRPGAVRRRSAVRPPASRGSGALDRPELRSNTGPQVHGAIGSRRYPRLLPGCLALVHQPRIRIRSRSCLASNHIDQCDVVGAGSACFARRRLWSRGLCLCSPTR